MKLKKESEKKDWITKPRHNGKGDLLYIPLDYVNHSHFTYNQTGTVVQIIAIWADIINYNIYFGHS